MRQRTSTRWQIVLLLIATVVAPSFCRSIPDAQNTGDSAASTGTDAAFLENAAQESSGAATSVGAAAGPRPVALGAPAVQQVLHDSGGGAVTEPSSQQLVPTSYEANATLMPLQESAAAFGNTTVPPQVPLPVPANESAVGITPVGPADQQVAAAAAAAVSPAAATDGVNTTAQLPAAQGDGPVPDLAIVSASGAQTAGPSSHLDGAAAPDGTADVGPPTAPPAVDITSRLPTAPGQAVTANRSIEAGTQAQPITEPNATATPSGNTGAAPDQSVESISRMQLLLVTCSAKLCFVICHARHICYGPPPLWCACLNDEFIVMATCTEPIQVTWFETRSTP